MQFTYQKPRFSRLTSHRKWLRTYEAELKAQANSLVEEQQNSVMANQSLVLELLRKPAWALTEEEAEERQRVEEDELIEFCQSLDYDELVTQLETPETPSIQHSEIAKVEPEDPPPSVSHPLATFTSHNPFIDPPMRDFVSGSDLPVTSDRHVVISADVVRNIPHSVSNLPYLRLCPSV